ncbi:hypothetical protein VOI54_15160 [Tamlana sp. 2201CG12-4]|uniref:hypothetical protein n=1 Tax=Tamlana sp. 2201CG12-4 TaxID=3112582 RepID=UPI002DBC5D8B|nr:hypothetical protein [Tamlana sp. 2201CG12-4]MEC3908368.1 hypothetical protein [Tamlana sp. 2201CG12-4]
MKTKHLFYLIGISIFLFSCSSSSPDDVTPPDPDPDPTDKVTYDDDISSIMSNNCTRCHGNPPSQGAPFSLTTFTGVSSRVDRIIARVNSSSNPMPPDGQIELELRQKIEQWKDDGLLEN